MATETPYWYGGKMDLICLIALSRKRPKCFINAVQEFRFGVLALSAAYDTHA